MLALLLAVHTSAPVVAPSPLAGTTIVVDPGHPSEVGIGTRGARVTELEICWKIGLSLKEYLKRKGATVVLTKDSMNQMVRNQQRAEVGNKVGANYVIRLHCDAADGRGFSTYYPSRQGTVRGVTGPSAQVIAESKKFAAVFHPALARELSGHLRDRGPKTDLQTAVGVRQGALTGSIFSQVPVVLIEMAVLTNPQDEAWIEKRENQLLYAQAITNATEAVFRKYPAMN